jgi:molecular chaperone DnaK
MVKDAASHSRRTSKRREEIEAKNRLDSMIYSSEKTFNENRSSSTPQDASEFESALADAKKALEAGGSGRDERGPERLQQASHKLAEAMYRERAAPARRRSAPGGSGPGQTPPEGGSRPGAEDEVIDTEYVDTEKN